jgi:hypothetical protein
MCATQGLISEWVVKWLMCNSSFSLETLAFLGFLLFFVFPLRSSHSRVMASFVSEPCEARFLHAVYVSVPPWDKGMDSKEARTWCMIRSTPRPLRPVPMGISVFFFEKFAEILKKTFWKVYPDFAKMPRIPWEI